MRWEVGEISLNARRGADEDAADAVNGIGGVSKKPLHRNVDRAAGTAASGIGEHVHVGYDGTVEQQLAEAGFLDSRTGAEAEAARSHDCGVGLSDGTARRLYGLQIERQRRRHATSTQCVRGFASWQNSLPVDP